MPGAQTLKPLIEQEAQAARLPELCPPQVLPKGNVGTPLSLLRELVRSCQLPPKLLEEVQANAHLWLTLE